MATKNMWPRLPPKLQLFVDFVIILLFFSLDARDLVYKTKWLGPSDSYSFMTKTSQRLQPEPLIPVVNATIPRQRIQRNTGWSSFLEKCKSIHAIMGENNAFSHVLAKDCQVGRIRIPELILSSSVRVDSMAWAACKMLYHHRKPPICHSPIVQTFGRRYNIDERPSIANVITSRKEGILKTVRIKQQGVYSAEPGSDAEMEVIELLQVISMSAPLSNVVCVEGFIHEGPGYYTSSLFACASPNYHHSSFVGSLAAGFKQYQQNKAWLSADMLHVSGMSYMVRENRRSLFIVKGNDGTMNNNHTELILEHKTQLNFSSYGVLYTIAILVDVILLIVDMYAAIEIGKLMLWPLYQSLCMTETTVVTSVSNSSSRAAFAAEDCQAVLTASMYRSKPIVLAMVLSHSLHWMMMIPNVTVLAEATSSTAQIHAILSTFRFWVVVLITLNFMWDFVVFCRERMALALVHCTYITVTEVAFITGIVGYYYRSSLLVLPQQKQLVEGTRLVDTISFSSVKTYKAISNAYVEHHDSLQNTPVAVLCVLYTPVLKMIGTSLLIIILYLAVRFVYYQTRYPSVLKPHKKYLFGKKLWRHESSVALPVKPDLSDLIIDPPPPQNDETHAVPESGEELNLRLPIEQVVDLPIRARSLVRNAWKMVKHVGPRRVFLRPPQYLEHGIILMGGYMKTRFGFMNVVHPYLRAEDHIMIVDEEEIDANVRTSTASPTTPRPVVKRSSFAKPEVASTRTPLVPLR